MNIELRFLQKAVIDRNYVSFSYENINIKKAKPLKLINKEDNYILHTDNGVFNFNGISKFKVLKERF